MPPLSLEQVLARSMRLPRQRARHQVSSLFAPAQAGADVTYRAHPAPPPPAAGGVSASRRQAQRLSFFELMDAQDAQRSAGHLRIHRPPSDALVKNSTDLLSFLVTAQRMGDWQDGLQAFLKATETTIEPVQSGTAVRLARVPPPAPQRVSPHAGPSSSPSPSASSSTAPPEPMLVHPSEDHVRALLDACADGGQQPLVVALCQFYGPAFPALITHATTRLVNDQEADEASVKQATSTKLSKSPTAAAVGARWQRGFRFLTEELALSPSQLPVEAFNVCLAACEAEKDWRGALRLVRQMGPNPLQSLTLDGETDAQPDKTGCGPVPDVVSYATLIATLEQAGKSTLVPQILNHLPPVEKEEITASYAALIYVWSNQVYDKQNRRF